VTVRGKTQVAMCKNCKRHQSNPSYCKLKQEYVGKTDTCDDHKRDKR